LLAPILTPILLKIFAGQLIEIELASMMISITKMVILPILLGLAFHKILGAKVQIANDILPMVSVLGIAIIIAAVIAVSRDTILTSGLLVFIVVWPYITVSVTYWAIYWRN